MMVQSLKPEEVAALRIYKHKLKEGQVERVHDETTVICKNLFQPGAAACNAATPSPGPALRSPAARPANAAAPSPGAPPPERPTRLPRPPA